MADLTSPEPVEGQRFDRLSARCRTPGPVDSHVHLWDLNRRRLPWLSIDNPLRRTITAADLRRAACDPGWTFVVVQADADPAEVIDLLDVAAVEPAIGGVVGWFDLTDRWLSDAIDRAHDHADRVGARLVGVRCPPADQRDPAALSDPALQNGVRLAARAGLTIDLLLRPPALAAAARLAASVPEGIFVVDHLGLPTADDDHHWRTGIAALAERPNVMIKLSGFATTPPDNISYVLDRLGAHRVMFGSDWPVSSTDFPALLTRADELVPATARPDVFSETARRVYRLDAPPSISPRSDQRSEDHYAWAQST